jgi:hypothetical protein
MLSNDKWLINWLRVAWLNKMRLDCLVVGSINVLLRQLRILTISIERYIEVQIAEPSRLQYGACS